MTLGLVLNSILLGVGLAMDAFSVSIADALNAPGMPLRRGCQIAGTFAAFQFMMPMTGWVCVHTLVEHFSLLRRFVPWIALILLVWLGGSMLREGIRGGIEKDISGIGNGALFMQGIATSIDALSVGFTISEYGAATAVICSAIIAAVTFVICIGGIHIGKAVGMRMARRAPILGGIILIAIGLEIFIKGIFV